MPSWVNEGYREYEKRLPNDFQLEMIELPLGHRGKSSDIAKAKKQEGDQMLAAIPKGDRVIALEVLRQKLVNGAARGTQVEDWRMDGRNISLLIGGPDGLDSRCSAMADQKWSLSALTSTPSVGSCDVG